MPIRDGWCINLSPFFILKTWVVYLLSIFAEHVKDIILPSSWLLLSVLDQGRASISLLQTVTSHFKLMLSFPSCLFVLFQLPLIFTEATLSLDSYQMVSHMCITSSWYMRFCCLQRPELSNEGTSSNCSFIRYLSPGTQKRCSLGRHTECLYCYGEPHILSNLQVSYFVN